MDVHFFSQNRDKLIAAAKGALIVVPAFTRTQQSIDMAHTFEQESCFWYLSGIKDPDWWLIIDGARGKSTLVAPQLNKYEAIFNGESSFETATVTSGVDDVIDQTSALSYFRQLAHSHSLVYTVDQPERLRKMNLSLNPAPGKMRELLRRHFKNVHDCRSKIMALRAIKQPEEIKRIKKAIAMTVAAFEKVHSSLHSYQYEYEIHANLSYEFRIHGGQGHAYDPVIASHRNSCIIHYDTNNQRLVKNKIILIDAAAKYQGYCADISRTYAYGEVSKETHHFHHCLSQAQQGIISLCRPGLPLRELQNSADNIMRVTLASLGLIKNETDEKFRNYFPHAIGHGIGLDVHDLFGDHDYLEPGMVLAIEPGIYSKEHKMGLRIEDDILITPKGPVNLSKKLSRQL